MADIFDVTGNKTYAAFDTGGNLEVAAKPDKKLALLQEQLSITPNNKDILDQINKRQSEIIQEYGLGAGGFGSGGTFIPSLQTYQADDKLNASLYDAQSSFLAKNAGKAVLTGGYKDAGLYSAEMIGSSGERVQLQGKTNDIAMKGTPFYDSNATGSKRSFFDATGRRLSASEVANTITGKEFAAAGWDIGFGPGMIAPGVKADTTARDAKLAAQESQIVQSSTSTQTKTNQPDVDPIPLTSSLLPVSTPTPPRPPAKTAPIDTVLFNDESISPEIMIDLVFEDIGGHELLSISRNDIINGQRVSYSPIKNLGLIQQTYNPNNLFSLQKTSDKYFANFAIKFDEKVPQEGSGENGVNVYIEEETGDLIIETVNMNNDEQVESEIAINGTIYEVNFGETVS